MKRGIWAAGLIAGCVSIGLFLMRQRSAELRTPQPIVMNAASTPQLARQPPEEQAGPAIRSAQPKPGGVTSRKVGIAPPTRGVAPQSAAQERAAAADKQLLVVKRYLRDYRAAFGQNPIGNNAEITKALLGANPAHSRFLPPQAEVNAAGQLMDRWGHPYFFHQISGVQMEVRSAGPDGVLWTEDDEVTR